MITIIVCGGRGFKDRQRVFSVLDHVHAKRTIAKVIHGNASGADKLSGEWAKENGVSVVPCSADWKSYGRAAGPIRNKLMAGLGADGVVAFPGGDGTADMCRQAADAGIPVMVISP